MEKNEKWMTTADIFRFIYERTGWLIPTNYVRNYLKNFKYLHSSQRIEKTKRGRFRIYVHPDVANFIIDRQVDEIEKFKKFCQKYGPATPDSFQGAQAILKVSTPGAIGRLLGMSICQVNNFIRSNRIPKQRFRIMGLSRPENHCLVSFNSFNNVLNKIGKKATRKNLNLSEEREEGKKIIRDWWTSKDVIREIEKEHPGWGIKFLESIREEVKKGKKGNRQLVESCIFLPWQRKYLFNPDIMGQIIERQNKEIRHLKDFAKHHFTPPRIIDSPQEAKRLQAEWGSSCVADRLGVRGESFYRKNPGLVYHFFVLGIGGWRFTLVSQKELNDFLNKIKKELERLGYSNLLDNSLPLDSAFFRNAPKNWYTLRQIREEIRLRTGWSVPSISLRRYMKKKISGLKLEYFTGARFVYFPPKESRELIKEQCREIERLRLFIERIMDPDMPGSLGEDDLRLLVRRYRAGALQKRFGIKERQFKKMVDEGLFKKESFFILGLGEFSLYAPPFSMVIDAGIRRLIEKYVSFPEERKDVWSELVQSAKRYPEDFIRVVSSNDDLMAKFRESKPGKMLIDYIEGLIKRIRLYKERNNLLFKNPD